VGTAKYLAVLVGILDNAAFHLDQPDCRKVWSEIERCV
jgi:hypothetical protein